MASDLVVRIVERYLADHRNRLDDLMNRAESGSLKFSFEIKSEEI
jgi:hypothetical protein